MALTKASGVFSKSLLVLDLKSKAGTPDEDSDMGSSQTLLLLWTHQIYRYTQRNPLCEKSS